MNVTPQQLLAQYERANKQWPWIHDVNGKHGLPPFTMHALGSRETGLTNVVSANRKDWGVWQRDVVNGIPPDWMDDVRAQCEWSASVVAAHVKTCGEIAGACNRYNSGSSCLASRTTGGDYGPDVAERRKWLEENISELWHPNCVKVEPSDGHNGFDFLGVPTKIVIHTTETDAYTPSHGSYYGNPFWPHATIVGPGVAFSLAALVGAHSGLVGDELHLTWNEWRKMVFMAHKLPAMEAAGPLDAPGTIYQHLPINVSGYALAHEYAPETNGANAIQCEVVWRAADGDWPDGLLATLASWIRWVQSQTGTPTVFAEMFREGVTVASVDSPIRFKPQEWLDFNGICGHSNVPGGNDHWDPGRLPVEKLRALLVPPPISREALPMEFTYVAKGEDFVYLGVEGFHGRLPFGSTLDVLKQTGQLKDLGHQPPEFHQGVKVLADQLGFLGDA